MVALSDFSAKYLRPNIAFISVVLLASLLSLYELSSKSIWYPLISLLYCFLPLGVMGSGKPASVLLGLFRGWWFCFHEGQNRHVKVR